MKSLRFWLNNKLYRFLGLFSEVRELRTLRLEYESRCRDIYAKELEHRKQAEHADIERAKAEHELSDTKRALEVMTEARLNADRAVEVIRGQMDAMRETNEREIASMKQTVDFFGLQSCGRQIFGTAPLVTRPREEQAEATPARINARHLVQQQTQAFLQEAQRRMAEQGRLPNEGPEYSSTSIATQEPAA